MAHFGEASTQLPRELSPAALQQSPRTRALEPHDAGDVILTHAFTVPKPDRLLLLVGEYGSSRLQHDFLALGLAQL